MVDISCSQKSTGAAAYFSRIKEHVNSLKLGADNDSGFNFTKDIFKLKEPEDYSKINQVAAKLGGMDGNRYLSQTEKVAILSYLDSLDGDLDGKYQEARVSEAITSIESGDGLSKIKDILKEITDLEKPSSQKDGRYDDRVLIKKTSGDQTTVVLDAGTANERTLYISPNGEMNYVNKGQSINKKIDTSKTREVDALQYDFTQDSNYNNVTLLDSTGKPEYVVRRDKSGQVQLQKIGSESCIEYTKDGKVVEVKPQYNSASGGCSGTPTGWNRAERSGESWGNEPAPSTSSSPSSSSSSTSSSGKTAAEAVGDSKRPDTKEPKKSASKGNKANNNMMMLMLLLAMRGGNMGGMNPLILMMMMSKMNGGNNGDAMKTMLPLMMLSGGGLGSIA